MLRCDALNNICGRKYVKLEIYLKTNIISMIKTQLFAGLISPRILGQGSALVDPGDCAGLILHPQPAGEGREKAASGFGRAEAARDLTRL